MRALIRLLIVLLLAGLCTLAASIEWGGPKTLPPAAALTAPFAAVDTTGLPPIERYPTRSGAALAFRRYSPEAGPARASITLIHGAWMRSDNLHALARALANAGFTVYLPDVRGHGESGLHGVADYVGQLDDDIEDFVKHVKPEAPSLLAGFSSGGGLALRIAGSPRQTLFDGYVLAAPFLSQRATTWRGAVADQVSIGTPRVVALTVLNFFGMTRYDDMPVMRFALDEVAARKLTPLYSYTLATSFRPKPDYRAQIAAITRPVQVVVGGNDEWFVPDQFASEFERAGHAVPVTIVPSVGHLGLILETPGIQGIVDSANKALPTRL